MKMAFSLVWTLVLLAAISCPAINAQGQQVSVSEVPSIAQVEFRVGVVWVQQCVASVLTSVHVLGTATCFSGSLYLRENRRIRAGSSTRGRDGSIVNIGSVTIHPDYSTGSSDSDIAVVRLASAFVLGGNIQQGQILAQGVTLPAGLPVNLFGWGTTAQGSSPSDGNLYRSGLVTLPPCDDSFSDQTVTDNMICAGPQTDYDARDLGAPIVFDNIIIGMTCLGASSSPVVGTSISSFTNWIVANAV